MDDEPIKPGDWVRFYQNGMLVIGVVQYVTYDSLMFRHMLSTDCGVVPTTSVVEVRRA